jgi:hypothetical protein
MKLRRVVVTMKTTKGKGIKNMEEGMRDEVEAIRNKEVEARTKGRRRGKKMEKKKKCQNIQKEYPRRDKPKMNESNNKT